MKDNSLFARMDVYKCVCKNVCTYVCMQAPENMYLLEEQSLNLTPSYSRGYDVLVTSSDSPAC